MKTWMKYFNRVVYNEAADGEVGGAGGGAPVETPEVEEEFDGGFLLDDEFEPEVEPEPESEPEPKPEPEPEATPEPEPEPEKPEPKQEEPKPEEKKPEEQKPEQPSAEEQQARKDAWLAEVQKSFAISEEDANLLVTEPENVLPRLATNIYARAMDDVQQMFTQLLQGLPQMVQQINTQATTETETKASFMQLTPGLEQVPAETVDTLVKQLAPVIKEQMPDSTVEERMKRLGQAVLAMSGIAAKPAVKKPEATPPQPHTPAATRSSGIPNAPVELTGDEAFIADFIKFDNF